MRFIVLSYYTTNCASNLALFYLYTSSLGRKNFQFWETTMARKIKPPSTLEFITFPVFALSWYASPPGLFRQCNVFAYCGGGGSAKTGVGNSVQVIITLPASRGVKRRVSIDTGVDIGVAVSLFQPLTEGLENSLWVLVCVGDEVHLYSISLLENPEDDGGDATMLDKAVLGKGYGANALAFHPLGNKISVGCENGKVVVFDLCNSDAGFHFRQYMEMDGHIKAVCTLAFSPQNGNILISSAKDGTCRLWDISTKMAIGVLQCHIYDPNKPTPTNSKITNPKPGQLLVRGCAFGDLLGETIYTVQSGRKGSAFLSYWKLIQLPHQQDVSSVQQKGSHPIEPQYQEQFRKCISPYPVSAISLSGDYSMLSFGDTNGTITLLSTTTLKPLKKWEEVHDLPVTCIAARPLPFELPGEEMTGIKIDIISASADNRLLALTLQRKSTLKPIKKKRTGSKSAGEISFGILNSFILIILLIGLAYIVTDFYDECTDIHIFEDKEQAIECLLDSVLWSRQDRPGVSFVPH